MVCLTDRKPGPHCHCRACPISYELSLTLTAPPIAFLRASAREYGRSRISREQLHNVRMDTSRLEKPVRLEVRMAYHVLKFDAGE